MSKDPIERVIEAASRKDISETEKHRLVDEIDPDGSITRAAIDQIARDLAGTKTDIDRREKLIASMHRLFDGINPLRLAKNECSRIHKLIDAVESGLFFDGELRQFMPKGQRGNIAESKVFVVRHDWAAALGDQFDFDPTDPFKLPYPNCAFEFRIGASVAVMTMHDREDRPGINTALTFEGVEGVWFSLSEDACNTIHRFLERQVRAICVALEAQVATHDVVRAPGKLNAKRERAGRAPLADFHVIDLSRRSRATARPEQNPTGRRVRLHFRRGHWRHYEDHNTWIEWMLVGDPDLGFIDKHYRI